MKTLEIFSNAEKNYIYIIKDRVTDCISTYFDTDGEKNKGKIRERRWN